MPICLIFSIKVRIANGLNLEINSQSDSWAQRDSEL